MKIIKDMKRIFMALLASVALFVGCTKDNTDVQDGGETGLIPVKFTVASLAEATRVSGTAFEVGDEIGMFITKVGETEPYVENVKFTVKDNGSLEPDSPVYYPVDRNKVSVVAYYPYSSNGSTSADVALAADQSKGLPDASLYRAEQTVTPSKNAVALNFGRALARVRIFVYDAPADLSTAKVSFNAAVKGSIDLKTTESTFNELAKVTAALVDDHFEVVLLPQIIDNGRKISVVFDAVDYNFTLTRDYTLTAGSSNDIELNMDADYESPVDLSEFGTANCYIVNKPGTTYRFRADIMGNGAATEGITPSKIAPTKARLLKTHVADMGYKGGTTYGSDGTMSKLILKNSVELKTKRGVPYVYFTTPATLAAGNALIAATDDEGNVLWSWHMWVTPDYELGKGDLTITANANSTGVVMMDRNLGAFSNGTEPDETYTAEQNAYAAAGLVYEFGRKDPFFFTNPGKWTFGNYQMADGTVVEVQGANKKQNANKEWETVSVRLTSDNAPTVEKAIAYSVANPEIFLRGFEGDKQRYQHTWATASTDPKSISFLWGNTEQSRDAKAGEKTIYDPCPVGYKVPGPNAFAFWNQSGNDMAGVYHYTNPERYNFDQTKTTLTVDTEKKTVTLNCDASFGYYCYTASVLNDGQTEADRTDKTTTFFPALGAVTYDANQSIAVGELSMMTNSLPDGSVNPRAAYINRSGSIYFSSPGNYYGWCTTALPIRCIKE